MTEIPEDIRMKAKFCIVSILADMARAEVEGRPISEDSPGKWQETVGKSLLAERERCAKIAYAMAADEVDHASSGALFRAYRSIKGGD